MIQKDFLYDKLESGVELKEKEIEDILQCSKQISEWRDENLGRWRQKVVSVIEVRGKYYEIVWGEGLTEDCDDSYNNQPNEVIKKVETIYQEIISYEHKNKEVS